MYLSKPITITSPKPQRPFGKLISGDGVVALSMAVFLESLWAFGGHVKGREVWCLVEVFGTDGKQGRIGEVKAMLREAEGQGWIFRVDKPAPTVFGYVQHQDPFDALWTANRSNPAYARWANEATASYGLDPLRVDEEDLPSLAEVAPAVREGVESWDGPPLVVRVQTEDV